MPHLGIDLGTTNCALAVCETSEESKAQVVDIAQLIAPGETHTESLLESVLYLARPGEFPEGALDLAWAGGRDFMVGRAAAQRGAETAGRLVTSAKSWLSYTAADRMADILPLNAPEGSARVSPVEASRRYLEHLRDAWNHAHPDAPLEEHPVVLTVPASFDVVARELTERAAEQAGYRKLTLLEEPQAAFYAWIERHADWRERVQPGDLILVIDVGGGTTDLTLIAVSEKEGSLQLERVAVGEHLLLGGDNMDLALSHSLVPKLPKLDALQFHALWQQCRLAKERLLSDAKAKDVPVTILGRGSSIIGGTIKAKLSREDVEKLLVDGFFPTVTSEQMPASRRRSGLVEVGLPYETDPAITKHLARFLRQGGTLAQPTHILFNGGVFKAAHLRKRVVEVLQSWLGRPIKQLEGEDLMHAVARGAAYYNRARQGKGVRIRGGLSRTYYIGIETAMPAVPGLAAPLKALSVAPFGLEEGTGTAVPSSEFGLIVGEPAEFRFFTSAARKQDAPGTMLDEITEEMEELAPIQVTLSGDSGAVVRVQLETQLTETGLLQIWCVARDGRRWKLEFQTRGAKA